MTGHADSAETPHEVLQRLLRALPLKASVRKLRLLAAVLVRLAQEHPNNASVKRFDDVIEACADAPRVWSEDFISELGTRPGDGWRFVHTLRNDRPSQLVKEIRKLFAFYQDIPVEAGLSYILDILGAEFDPVPFVPTWRTEAAVGLAAGMYGSRDFTLMPVLADALEDAGCTQPDVLAHCRGPGPHVRGCWVVDLVLDKA